VVIAVPAATVAIVARAKIVVIVARAATAKKPLANKET
jgi:hypothetical protein